MIAACARSHRWTGAKVSAMRRSLRFTLNALHSAGIKVRCVREASRHTEIVLKNGAVYRVPKGTHRSRRFDPGLRSFVRKLSRPEISP
jgi:hypothetical protein